MTSRTTSRTTNRMTSRMTSRMTTGMTSAVIPHPRLALKFALCIGLAIAATACDQTVKITDGNLPNELLPYIQPALGTYLGQTEHRATGLVMSLEGNHLTLKSTDDIIDPTCKSTIGNLLKLTYKENKDKTIQITEALFDFDPNLCGNEVAAKSISFSTVKNNPLTLDMLYLDHFEWRWQCGNGNYPPPGHPGSQCWQQQVAIYHTGRFVHN